jgi:predicted transcriptional regulator
MIQKGMVVEARTLARCCYENMFTVGGLHAEGVEFAERMKADDRAGRKNRLKFANESEAIFESLSSETQTAVQEALKNIQKGEFLKPKNASALGGFKDMYSVYGQFLGDAAHPTMTALARHWAPADKDKTIDFDVAPAAKDDELDETVHFACMAFLSVMVIVNEMADYTEAGKKLLAFDAELKSFLAERWGDEEIAEGMEIRAEKP